MMKFAFTIILFASFTCFAVGNFRPHMTVNATLNSTVTPSAPVAIEIYFSNPENQLIYKDFIPTNGKIMHMVLVKNDLSTFKKVYPYFDPSSGRFRVTLNTPHSDPDNAHASFALTDAGKYFVVVEVNVKELGLMSTHFSLIGEGHHQGTPIAVDPIDADMSITKYFAKTEKSERPHYRARLSHATSSICMAILNEFKLEVFTLNEQTNEYAPIKDIAPTLGRSAQAVWLSSTLASGHNSHHGIFHGDMADGIFKFIFKDKAKLLPGIQKIWFQLRHEGRNIIMPFVFDYNPEPITNDNC
tara:strand:+ start:13711 stop:14610 length:900 start_codon:yes stop_codon:yes gene_type:complete